MTRLLTRIVLTATMALPLCWFTAARAQTVPSAPATPPAPNELPGEAYIRARLAEARQRGDDRRPQIEAELRANQETLKSVEESLKDRITVDLLSRREELNRRRDLLRAEFKELQDVASTWNSAAEAHAELQRSRRDLENLRADLQRGAIRFRPGDALVYEAQLQQIRSVLRSQAENEASYRRELAEIENKLKAPQVDRRPILLAEKRTLQAQLETLPIRRAATEARKQLQEARLAAAREAQEKGNTATSRPGETQSAPSSAVAAREAENKQKLAAALESEARNQLEWARQEIARLQQERDEAVRKGESTERIDNDLQYWRESENYERSRVRQAALKKREAEQKQQILELEQRLQESQALLSRLGQESKRMSAEERRLLADDYRAKAIAVREEAEDLDRQAAGALNWMAATQESLLTIDATEKAIQERLNSAAAFADYQRLYNHYQRMRRVLDAERQQNDQMVTSQNVGHYQFLRQAQLKRQLAGLYGQLADVLVPPTPSFWERHRRIFRAVGIFAGMIAAGYVLKFFVWLTEVIATWLKATVPSYNFSVKRVTTLASFAGSITQLFVWIFGIITVLYEFGIDPATSSGAIGLVGLILAGMFQQIVVDFIKGLDIVAGRHYNVGDFVELDGKFGHVIDFNVKYTRIRTLSGQELNIPNSRCIPSRRFPEGYVDNYVDIVLNSGADVNEAKAAIQPVCLYLNRRLEPLKERPQFIDRFRAVGGRAILRYRVRVLPGCEWVITDYFIPAVKAALAARQIEMEAEPKFFFINRIDTFRKLFSRQLTEQEILQEASELETPTADRPAMTSGNGQAGHDDKPPLPSEGGAKTEAAASGSEQEHGDKPHVSPDGGSKPHRPSTSTPGPRRGREVGSSSTRE